MKVIFGSMIISFVITVSTVTIFNKIKNPTWANNEQALVEELVRVFPLHGSPTEVELRTAKCAAPLIAETADNLKCAIDPDDIKASIRTCSNENNGFALTSLAIMNSCYSTIVNQLFRELLEK